MTDDKNKNKKALPLNYYTNEHELYKKYAPKPQDLSALPAWHQPMQMPYLPSYTPPTLPTVNFSSVPSAISSLEDMARAAMQNKIAQAQARSAYEQAMAIHQLGLLDLAQRKFMYETTQTPEMISIMNKIYEGINNWIQEEKRKEEEKRKAALNTEKQDKKQNNSSIIDTIKKFLNPS